MWMPELWLGLQSPMVTFICATRVARSLRPTALVCMLAAASLAVIGQSELSEHETTVLKVCEGVVRLFERDADRIWPGYDLSQRPFIVYVPERWTILLNPPVGDREFGALPPRLPPLRVKAAYLEGPYRGLVGQLAFNFDVGGVKTVAIGLPEREFAGSDIKTRAMLGLVVHEAFHQYQNETFGNIPWEREERYPILDADNSGLAGLEMRILADAVAASLGGRRPSAEQLLRMFVAVRTTRWRQAAPFVARYEQGQEIREGTAAYVEKKTLELARTLGFRSALARGTTSLAKDLQPLPVSELFRRDFKERMTNGAVTPDGMIRDRIYPVGSALGFLADLWGPEWKDGLVREVDTFAFHRHFADKLHVKPEEIGRLVEDAKGRYAYPVIRASAADQISGYRAGYEKDKTTFEAQAGTRVEVRVRYRSISRSRNSDGRMWTVDDGTKTLLTRVHVYDLKMDGLSLQLQGTSVFETNDWDARDKRVAFFVAKPPELVLDGANKELGGASETVAFKAIALAGQNLALTAKLPGRVTLQSGRIVVEIGAVAGDLTAPAVSDGRESR